MTKETIIAEELGMEYHSMTSDQLSVFHRCMDEYAKQQSIAFFKWYGVKMVSFLEYLTNVKPIVKSEEIEEAIRKHEGATFEELYQQFIDYQFIEQQNKE